MPERVKWIRVLIAELQRISSHLVWFGTHGMEIGAITAMLYAFREREILMNLNEMLAGFRFFPSYIRVGGLREDIPRGFKEAVTAFLDRFPGKLDEYETLHHQEPDLARSHARRRRDHARRLLRLGAVRADRPRRRRRLRRAPRLPVYRATRPSSSTSSAPANGDVYDRYIMRVAEMRESVKICRQALERITPVGECAVNDRRIVPPPKDEVYTEMEALIQHFLIYSQGFNVPAGDAYVPVEGPRGEHGCYVVSDGTQPAVARAHALAGPDGLPGAAQVHRRRDDRGRHRGDRLARCGHGRRGSMSFHPAMPYGTERVASLAAQDAARGPGVRSSRPSIAAEFEEFAAHYPPEHRKSAILTRSISRRSSRATSPPTPRGTSAEVVGITTADVEDVVSVLRDVPPQSRGHVRAAGVHTLSCALAGAERVVERLEQMLGDQGRRDRSVRHVHDSADGVPRRLRQGARGDGEQRALARVPHARTDVPAFVDASSARAAEGAAAAAISTSNTARERAERQDDRAGAARRR